MYAEWIKRARAHAKMSQEQLAKDINVTKGNISAWENGRHKPDEGDIVKMSIATNYPVPSLVKSQMRQALSIAKESFTSGHRVPVLEASASMGTGAIQNDADVISDWIALTEQFIVSLKPSHKGNLRFIHAYGDSMSPTFENGDIALVDTGIGSVTIDGVYVLEAHGRIYIKRVRQRLDGAYEISSDNPSAKTVDVLNGDSEVTVLGRVLFAWNGKTLG